MARSKSDISNSAIRIFLQNVGKFYDVTRGFEPFGPKKSQKEELLSIFDYKCCFCSKSLTVKTLSQDHLVPMNKTSLGLHAWGNIVPCCKDCNSEKQQKPWRQFTKKKAGQEAAQLISKIDSFVDSMYYDPSLDLHDFAGNLYDDVGEVALTLINLRYKQAEEGIRQLLGYGEVIEDNSMVMPNNVDETNNVPGTTDRQQIDWLRKLRSVGLEAFINNYELFDEYAHGKKSYSDSIEKLVDLGVSNRAGATIRLGNAKRIFESDCEKKALKKIVNSNRLSESVRNRAAEILSVLK